MLAPRYLFAGLGHLMEHKLIKNARKLRLPNAFGIKKINRNILALQQAVKTLTDDARDSEFERAKRYYALFSISPQVRPNLLYLIMCAASIDQCTSTLRTQEMLDGIRKRQSYSFDDYQTMLNLQCGVDPASADGAAQATDRNYSMYMIDLHGLEMEQSDAVSK
jgi:exocyst complex component 4